MQPPLAGFAVDTDDARPATTLTTTRCGEVPRAVGGFDSAEPKPRSLICRRRVVWWRCVRERWPLTEVAMRPMRVVVLDEDAQDVLTLLAVVGIGTLS